MGRILSFMPRPAANNRPPRNAGMPAAVIIFPGVRYERPLGADARAGNLAAGKPAPSLTKPAPRH
jgi:hypothetical protein